MKVTLSSKAAKVWSPSTCRRRGKTRQGSGDPPANRDLIKKVRQPRNRSPALSLRRRKGCLGPRQPQRRRKRKTGHAPWGSTAPRVRRSAS